MSNKTVGPPEQTTKEVHAVLSRDEIQERAYYRYVERGRTDGQAMADWLAAESEVRQTASNRPESQ